MEFPKYFFLISLALFLSPILTKACNCPEKESTITAGQNASAVFTGKVVSIKDRGNSVDVLFEIDMLWKGIINVEMVVTTPKDECDWNFQLDENYLVFAHKGQNGRLTTDKCLNTELFQESNENIKYLGAYIFPRDHIYDCSYNNVANLFIGCYSIYMPVCGCDGRTYSNPCEAKARGITDWNRGECY